MAAFQWKWHNWENYIFQEKINDDLISLVKEMEADRSNIDMFIRKTNFITRAIIFIYYYYLFIY